MYKEEFNKKNIMKGNEYIKRYGYENNDLVCDYLLFLQSGNSRTNYFLTLNRFFEFLRANGRLKHIPKNVTVDDMRKINQKDISKYIEYLSKDHKKTSIKQTIQRLSSFWSYLVEAYDGFRNIVKLTPTAKIRAKNDKELKMPDKEAIEELERNIKEHSKNDRLKERNLAIIHLFLSSGLRINELSNLNIDDIVINEKGTSYLYTVRKGYYDDESCNKVYLFDSVVPYINKWLEARKNMNVVDKEALFINNRGKRLAIEGIRQVFRDYNCSKTNITPHMLRHYYITKLYEATGDIEFVQDQCGHVKGSIITGDVYISSADANIDKLKKL